VRVTSSTCSGAPPRETIRYTGTLRTPA
jgi:hypothetical protein